MRHEPLYSGYRRRVASALARLAQHEPATVAVAVLPTAPPTPPAAAEDAADAIMRQMRPQQASFGDNCDDDE
jgi:hypothetical protein